MRRCKRKLRNKNIESRKVRRPIFIKWGKIDQFFFLPALFET